MKKCFRISLIAFAMVTILCFVLTGCGKTTVVDEYKDKGNKVTVRYEANGGTYLDREGITLIDMFNPADYTADQSGVTHIKLLDPTSTKRPDPIYITRTDYFLVGWYKNREEKTNSEGQVIDEMGKALVKKGDNYFLKEDETKEARPAYNYSGYWNFETDTIDFSSDMKEYELTLYAAWLNYFEFNYYYQVDGDWKSIGKTTFDYMTTNKEGSTTSDKDTIWLPKWEDGALVYSHKYSNGSQYTFPKVSGYTFTGAYLDENLTEEITTEEFEHKGTIDFATGVAVNPVQNIYLKLEEGEKYYISSAKQFVDNANLNGIYEIQADLDFNGLSWPTSLGLGEFKGKIYGKDGVNYKMSNITVNHSNANAKTGGVFGSISKDATISNITFDNITFNLEYCGSRNKGVSFGLFAGSIETGAKLTDVSISGTMKLGEIALVADNYSLNLVANGDKSNVQTLTTIHLVVYGTESLDIDGKTVIYSFSIDKDKVTINEDGDISLEFKTGLKSPDKSYDIQ